jgi:hypothetical protein
MRDVLTSLGPRVTSTKQGEGSIKVQVTFDVGDEARIGIALRTNRELRPATRIECAEWLLGVGDSELRALATMVNTVKAQLLDTELEAVVEAKLTG